MTTATEPKKTVAQIKEDIRRYHEKNVEEREAQKTNPHLEALVRLEYGMKNGKVHFETATAKLGDIISGMTESPLVLKVQPEVLKYVDTNTFRTRLAMPCGALGLRDAKNRAVQMIQALNFLLYLVNEPSEIEHSRDRVIKVLSDALFWVCEYLDEVDAREHMPPEEAALCALTGDSFFGFCNRGPGHE